MTEHLINLAHQAIKMACHFVKSLSTNGARSTGLTVSATYHQNNPATSSIRLKMMC